MDYYCGIDLHSTNSVLAVIDAEGKVVLRRRIPNDLQTILALLETMKSSLRGVVVESTYNWYWLVDGLMDADYKLHLANPAAIKQYAGLKFTDDNSDAAWLAEMLRLGILPEGYIYPKQSRSTRDLLRKRGHLVRQRTANILSIQNIVTRNTGVTVKADVIKQWSEGEIEELFTDKDLTLPLQACHAVVRCLNEKIRELEKRALERVRPRPEYKVLRSVPGIGKVLALTIMLETGDIGRFPSVGNYASYCRCVGSKRLSNGKKKGTGNSKNGNKYLAWAYVEAAVFAVRFNPIIQRFHQRKKTKTKLNVVATKTVAHKLARACYHMLKQQVEFDVERAFF
jgi:transposase